MASSYANLFGTTGAGKQGSKAGIGTLFGQQPAPQGDDEEIMRRKQQAAQAAQGGQAPQPTFAERQKMGQARPAPPAQAAAPAQAAPLVQRVKQQLAPGGLTTAGAGDILTKTAPAAAPAAAPMAAPEAAATGMGGMAPMKPPVALTPSGTPVGAPAAPGAVAAPQAPTGASLAQTLQQQLMGLMQGGGYTDEEFNQLRAAQEANLRAEYGAEQQRLNEELARRGLSASTIGGGRMGDLAGQQARALATMQATLLGQQAEMRQRARETGISAMSDLTRTMLTNEQAQAETRLKEQLGMSELGGVMYKRGPDGQLVPMTDAENKQIQTLAAQEVARKYGIAESELTGMFEGRETLPARTQRQNMALQLAQVLAGSDDPEILKNIMPYIYEAFGITPPGEDDEEEGGDEGGTDATTGRTATRRTTSTVGSTPGGTTNVPGGTTPRPGIPIAPREEPAPEPVEPKGPQKPGLGRPASTAADLVDVTQPVLTAAEEPVAPPPPPAPLQDRLAELLGGQEPMPILQELPPELAPAAPAPAEDTRPIIEVLNEILGNQPILMPAEEMVPPAAIPPVAAEPAPARRRVDPEELERELLALLQPRVPAVPATPIPTARKR